jgi:hypothetical protein
VTTWPKLVEAGEAESLVDVAAWPTATVAGPDDPTVSASPEYVAVRVCAPVEE